MSKGNTLFNYFNKTPNGKNATKESKDTVNKVKEKEENTFNFKVGELTWSKLEGFPYWPSLVCNHPTEKSHIRKNKNNTLIHIQFFDDPPTRSWIKEKYMKPYEGSDHKEFRRGGQFHSTRPDVNKAVLEADEAMGMPLEERLDLVVPMEATSEEDEEDDEANALVTGVDFDDDIFDNEADSGKENESLNENRMELDNKSPTKKTPSKKSPQQNKKETREPKKKRRKIIESDNEADTSEDEFKPGSGGESSSGDSSGDNEGDLSEPDSQSDPETPVKSRKRKKPEPSPIATPKVKKTTEALKSFISTPSTSSGEKQAFTPSVSDKTKSKLFGFSAPDSAPTGGEPDKVFKHLTDEYSWLRPENIRDAEKRKPDHPQYDKKTLYIPESAHKIMTPAMRQWWDIKVNHFDTVLFFKMGKFYELFHMDAVVAVNELGLIYMKGDHAHGGFPEIGYGRYAEALLQKGYKVARIEQTETVPMMEERVKSLSRATKYDKVVRREVCSIQTKGTKRYSFIDGDSTDSTSSFLLAICEKEGIETGSGSTYGVCFVDTSIGKFHIGEFPDDRHCSRLRTLISHYAPAQVLYERGKISDKTQNILNNTLISAIKESLKPGSEFWDSTKTLKFLSESQYFVDEENKVEGRSHMPMALKNMIAEGDTLGHSAADGYDQAISALGAVTWYLKECLMEEELLSMNNFEKYVPLDNLNTPLSSQESISKSQVPDFMTGRQKMVLDGVTLANLDILVNSDSGTLEGTLLEVLDQCSTPFGKRLFKEWLSAPLCNPSSINNRLDAVEDLINNQDVVAEVIDLLKKLPDLERQLNKIHTLGSVRRSKTHPDSRAIFFEDAIYSKRKIEDLLSTLGGFKTAQTIVQKFKSAADIKSSTLCQVVTVKSEENDRGKFPDMKDDLNFFDKAFDPEKARKDGTIKPTKGMNPAFDSALSDIKDVKEKLDNYLDRQKQLLGCRTIVYWGTGKNRYQMEIPESACKRLPSDYIVQSTKKGYKRYRTKCIEDLLAELVDCEERKEAAEKDTLRAVFYNFDKSYEKWECAVQCLSVLDVLINLSQFSRCGDGVMCRPQIVTPKDGCQAQKQVDKCESTWRSLWVVFYLYQQQLKKNTTVMETLARRHRTYRAQSVQSPVSRKTSTATRIHSTPRPFLEIREGRHPCISRTFSGGDYIPNDTVIGIRNENDMDDDDSQEQGNAQVVLVTGPNMGGKSTLMRQVGVIVVMAQLGCFVPAESCKLTPVDRVFTRLGATDRIMAGESTFYVELSETSSILQHATQHSLVLMDELGRGTATYDGTSIACAVVTEMSQKISCRTLFSTHYHSLVEEFSHDPNIRTGHMSRIDGNCQIPYFNLIGGVKYMARGRKACMVENENETDPTQETITFLYKFIKGECPKSYGFNAAKLADIPDEIISVAHQKAKDFENTVNKMKLFRSLCNSNVIKDFKATHALLSTLC